MSFLDASLGYDILAGATTARPLGLRPQLHVLCLRAYLAVRAGPRGEVPVDAARPHAVLGPHGERCECCCEALGGRICKGGLRAAQNSV